jgi:hypothetical protein
MAQEIQKSIFALHLEYRSSLEKDTGKAHAWMQKGNIFLMIRQL